MDISEYKQLPDYLDPLAVDEYCLRALAESSTESIWITIEKPNPDKPEKIHRQDAKNAKFF